MDSVKKYLFVEKLLPRVSQAGFFITAFAWFMRASAVLTGLGVLAVWVLLWARIGDLDWLGIIGGVLGQILILVFGYTAVHIQLLRARDVAALPHAADYRVIPIVVIFMKTCGEVLAAFFLIGGMVLGIFVWCAGMIPARLPGFGYSGTGAMGGFMFILVGVVQGFLVLFFAHFIAEQTGVFVDIARNTRKEDRP